MTTDHTHILDVLNACDAALRDKDLDALEQHYHPDAVFFDILTQVKGYPAIRTLWESCFPYFTNPIEFERRQLTITADQSTAAVACLTKVTGMADTPETANCSWFRSTIILTKQADTWRITHEHHSFPFDPETERPAKVDPSQPE